MRFRARHLLGWIGTPATVKYFTREGPRPEKSLRGWEGRVLLIGSGLVNFTGLSVELLQWDETTEVDHLKKFDVGIMPLPMNPGSEASAVSN